MKFDKMYKLLIVEGDEITDKEELEDVAPSIEDETNESETDIEPSDDGEVEDALEMLGLNDNTDIQEVQKREFATEAIRTKIYDKVKRGKLSKEDAVDILMNIHDEDASDDTGIEKTKRGGSSDRDPYQKRTNIDPNEYGDIARNYGMEQGTNRFMSGQDE